MNPTEAVITVKALSNQVANYPTAFWTIAAGLKKVHAVWQVVNQGSFYINPSNYYGIIVGRAVSAIDNPFVTYPTVPFFIIARFLDLFGQEDEWNQSKMKWVEAIRGVQPIYVKFELIKEEKRFKFISKHTVFWLKTTSYRISIRVQRIAMNTLNLAFQSFKLLMRLMDIVDLVNMEWNTLVQRSSQESGVHVPRCLSILLRSENKEMFMERLKGKKIGLVTAGKVYGLEKHKAAEITKTFFEFLEFGLYYYEKTAGIFGEAVISIIKQGVYDWSPENVKSYLQNNCLDPRSIDWLKKQKDHKIKSPPLDVISYSNEHLKVVVDDLKKTPLLSYPPFSVPENPNLNVYRVNGIKRTSSPLPIIYY